MVGKTYFVEMYIDFLSRYTLVCGLTFGLRLSLVNIPWGHLEMQCRYNETKQYLVDSVT